MEHLKIKCEKCGGTAEMDSDKIMAFCPYCGSKLTIDDNMKELLLSKEQTKREESWYEYDRQMYEIQSKSDKNFYKMALIIIIVFFSVFLILVLIAESSMF